MAGRPKAASRDMHFVYILRSKSNGRYYIGCTNNLAHRIEQHNAGDNKSTRVGRPWELITYKKFDDQLKAYNEEKLVKAYKGGNAFKKIVYGEVAEWPKATPC